MIHRSPGILSWLLWIEILLTPLRARGYTVKRDHTLKFDELPCVPYDDLRFNVLDGDLVFFGGNSLFSRVIRHLSGRSTVSHVGIAYWWKDRLMILESAVHDGVRMIPLRQYVENYENTRRPYKGRLYLARDRRLCRVPEGPGDTPRDTRNPAVDTLLAEAATLLNRNFSLRDALIFFWQGMTGRCRHTNNSELLCSEFVAACSGKVGLCFPDDGRGFIAPEHIAKSEDIAALAEISLGLPRPPTTGRPG